ncbi:Uncharacterized protein TCM_044269 [Theobroma cacao]|uniref:Uncharacterized protein n=1 Tax=Theobroma cacao TaxID=3641 RepID=A0A061FQC8_THECC|nr:Uncharacterized protein TCM_044269 [Theobroma cacao]
MLDHYKINLGSVYMHDMICNLSDYRLNAVELYKGLVVTTPLREGFIAEYEYRAGVVQLSPNYASVDYHYKKVKFEYLEEKPFYIKGDRSIVSNSIVLAMTTSRMIKSTHFLLVKTTYGAAQYARLYIDEIVHGVLVTVVSDRGT